MGYYTDNIRDIKCSVITCGRNAGRYTDEPFSVLVKWKSGYRDKLHQVYVNGKLLLATSHSGQREGLMSVPEFHNSYLRITVIAVDYDSAFIDYSGFLERGAKSRITLRLPRLMSLPINGRFNIYSNNGVGEVDYTEPINGLPVHIWPVDEDKPGYGMSVFGGSDFGFDSSAASGFGAGAFGLGEFGYDAGCIEWQSPELPNGRYRFAVKVENAHGIEGPAGTESGEIIVTGNYNGTERLEFDSYDADSNVLCLTTEH